MKNYLLFLLLIQLPGVYAMDNSIPEIQRDVPNSSTEQSFPRIVNKNKNTIHGTFLNGNQTIHNTIQKMPSSLESDDINFGQKAAAFAQFGVLGGIKEVAGQGVGTAVGLALTPILKPIFSDPSEKVKVDLDTLGVKINALQDLAELIDSSKAMHEKFISDDGFGKSVLTDTMLVQLTDHNRLQSYMNLSRGDVCSKYIQISTLKKRFEMLSLQLALKDQVNDETAKNEITQSFVSSFDTFNKELNNAILDLGNKSFVNKTETQMLSSFLCGSAAASGAIYLLSSVVKGIGDTVPRGCNLY